MNGDARDGGARDGGAGQTDADRQRRRWLALVEPLRAGAEFAALGASLGPLALAPRGDGHTVLVLPGLGGSDTSTAPLRRYLNWLGYTALPWELGRNRGLASSWPKLLDRVHAVLDTLPADGDASRISLVGWSLGGTLSLGIARAMPRRIRRVITLGSPQSKTPQLTTAWIRANYRALHPLRTRMEDLIDDWAPRPPPHTAIFSRSDAIVPWEVAMGGDATQDRIEVLGSHMGLGVNPAVLYAVADRLQAAPDAPFTPPLLLAALYPTPPSAARER